MDGRTPVGRATVAVLQMNAPERVQLRQALIDEGLLTLDARRLSDHGDGGILLHQSASETGPRISLIAGDRK